MVTGRHFAAVGATVAAGAVMLWLLGLQPSSPADSALVSREMRIRRSDPGVTESEIRESVVRSDQIVHAAEELGRTDVSAFLEERLDQAEPTEAEMRVFFEDNREVFGARGFEQSRLVIEQILKIRSVREGFAPRTNPESQGLSSDVSGG